MSRDVEQYSDPDTFLPERFEAMSPQEANKKDPRKYVFGFGRRYKQLQIDRGWL